MLREVDSNMESAQASMDAAAALDFRLERSVVEADSDISGTLSRLHAS